MMTRPRVGGLGDDDLAGNQHERGDGGQQNFFVHVTFLFEVVDVAKTGVDGSVQEVRQKIWHMDSWRTWARFLGRAPWSAKKSIVLKKE